ncbi:branched-subunit amino acid transport protein [Salsuginibacillus halophilus]|uniref:Branched-subunit amino acid transport protein n=1 Tax=Salsuginibacillus halophilus TaxID=517424 RepID=A0A2P8HXI6_9BACI|nr:AzlD domain-containing protein [Salsuginibacillus halophilus]PSL50949.1 branched-subunit amino acid transport protein [Salsuginibacillus halophilus]
MSYEMMLLILGMAVVTYIPRMVPLVFLNNKKMPSKLEGILHNVPYAALGALIFPGILFAAETIWLGLAGGATALILAWRGHHMMTVVIASIGTLLVLQLLFPG